MGTGAIILAVLSYAIVAFFIHRGENSRVKDGATRCRTSYFIALPVIGAFLFGVAMFFAMMFNLEEGKIRVTDAKDCEESTHVFPIASIVRGKQSSGSFFLGTGSVGTTTYYYTYIEEKRGFKLYSYKTTATHIVETDGEPNFTYNNYACPMPNNDFFFGGEHYRVNKEYNKVFNVPPNTILREFKL